MTSVLVLLWIRAFCWVAMAALCTGSKDSCVFEGHIQTDQAGQEWLANVTFRTADGNDINFEFSFPENRCCPNIISHRDVDLGNINDQMSCEEREDILPSNQIMPLNTSNELSGCELRMLNSGQATNNIYCSTSRYFKSAENTTWYFAASECSGVGLDLIYKMEVTSDGDLECPPDLNGGMRQSDSGFQRWTLVMIIIGVKYFIPGNNLYGY